MPDAIQRVFAVLVVAAPSSTAYVLTSPQGVR
jgi:hypothetical protein